MRLQVFACLLLAAWTCRPADSIVVGADDPVITLDGFCAGSVRPAGACKTVITRAQFESLAEALQPGLSLALKLKVANAYARNLRMSAAAEKRGLDKTSQFEEEMRFARMQLLAQDLDRLLQAESRNVTEADLQDYYKRHQSAFDEATVARIFIPRAVRGRTGSEDAMMKTAIALRARAIGGEDLERLQQDAYTEAGIARTGPTTIIKQVRRASLPPSHETVLDLKPGEVSRIFSDPGGARFIYKMIDKHTLTLDQAAAEIRSSIAGRRYEESLKSSLPGELSFSDAYFNPPSGPAAMPQPVHPF